MHNVRYFPRTRARLCVSGGADRVCVCVLSRALVRMHACVYEYVIQYASAVCFAHFIIHRTVAHMVHLTSSGVVIFPTFS